MALRVAIDANILITGIVWPRWPHEVLNHAVDNDFTLVLSPLVIQEARRRLQQDFPDLLDRLELFLLAVNYETAPTPTDEEIADHQDLVRQAKDVPIALSIQAAQVDYFVTYDRDFTDSGPTTAKVRQAIPGIMLPPVFLREVMNWTSEQLEAIRNRNWSEIEESD
jgi:putative PIN family toxin of toxin-antitoxin system